MGNRCIRDGSLYLLLTLAGAPGCDLFADPSLNPSASSSSDTSVLPTATTPGATTPSATTPSTTTPSATTPDASLPKAVAPEELATEFPDDVPPAPLCGDPLLGVDFVLDDSGLPTLYVDAATHAATPDGSPAAPFRTLGEALAAGGHSASDWGRGLSPTRRVLVAGGQYDEDVAIPPGTLVFGGYDAERWERGAAQSLISGSVELGIGAAPPGSAPPGGYLITGTTAAPPNTAPLAALAHFVVSDGIEVPSGARALLRDNVIAPKFYRAIDDPPDMRRAMAVRVDTATLRADGNRLIVPANDPGSVVSLGFSTWTSCAWITQNEITDYRSPISFSLGEGVAATFNVLERAENGVGASGNQALVAANFIRTYMPVSGCVYAMQLDQDAHPTIRDNTIYLTDAGNRGILEADAASRPTELLHNHFYSRGASPALYIDHRGPLVPELITSVDAVNALSGIPAIGGNTFARTTAAP